MRVRTLLRWHSRIGIVVCVWLLLLAGSGLVLQHSHRLGLDKPTLTGEIWYALADLPKPRVLGVEAHGVFQVDNRLVTRFGSQATLDGDLQGVVAGEESILVSDLGQLWLLTLEGELVDSVPLGGRSLVGVSEEGLPLLKHQQRHWQLDWWLEDEPVLTDSKVAFSPAPFIDSRLPAYIEDSQRGVSVERLILSLHSGRIFGALGEWLMSAVALLAIAIACTGFVIWGRRP